MDEQPQVDLQGVGSSPAVPRILLGALGQHWWNLLWGVPNYASYTGPKWSRLSESRAIVAKFGNQRNLDSRAALRWVWRISGNPCFRDRRLLYSFKSPGLLCEKSGHISTSDTPLGGDRTGLQRGVCNMSGKLRNQARRKSMRGLRDLIVVGLD